MSIWSSLSWWMWQMPTLFRWRWLMVEWSHILSLLKALKLRSASAEEHGTTRRNLTKDSTCAKRERTSGSIALILFTPSVMVLDRYYQLYLQGVAKTKKMTKQSLTLLRVLQKYSCRCTDVRGARCCHFFQTKQYFILSYNCLHRPHPLKSLCKVEGL